jgi:uncharacterized protein YhbP (UPF0306 family)
MLPKDIRLRQEIYAFIARHNVMTLAYQDIDGVGACAVWFATTEDLTCYFLSAMTTRHGAALRGGAEIAFTVHKDEQNWRTIQGVQGRGYCQPIAPEHRETAWQAYSTRFPFVIQPLGALAAALAAVTLWSVTPHWLRLIDNSKGFGHKEELVIENRLT